MSYKAADIAKRRAERQKELASRPVSQSVSQPVASQSQGYSSRYTEADIAKRRAERQQAQQARNDALNMLMTRNQMNTALGGVPQIGSMRPPEPAASTLAPVRAAQAQRQARQQQNDWVAQAAQFANQRMQNADTSRPIQEPQPYRPNERPGLGQNFMANLLQGSGLTSLVEAAENTILKDDKDLPQNYISNILNQTAQRGQQDAPAVATAGNIAGGVGALAGISAVTGGAGSALGVPANLGTRAMRSAITFGINRAANEAGALTGGRVSGERYGRDILRSGVSGAAGSVASGLVNSGISKVLVDKKLMTPFMEYVRNLGSSTAFSVANTGAEYALTEEEERPSSDQIARQLATSFLYNALMSGIETWQATDAAKARARAQAEQLQRELEALTRGSFSAEGYAERVNAITQRINEFRNSLNSTYYAGGQEYVNNMNSALDAMEDMLTQNVARYASAPSGAAPSVPLLGAAGDGFAAPAVNAPSPQPLAPVGAPESQSEIDTLTVELENAINEGFQSQLSDGDYIDFDDNSLVDYGDYEEDLPATVAPTEPTVPTTETAVPTTESAIPTTAPTEVLNEGFEDPGEINDPLMQLAMDTVTGNDAQKEAQRRSIMDAAKVNPEGLREVVDSATMLTDDEKSAAITDGLIEKNQEELATLMREVEDGRREEGDNGYSAGSERLLGDRTGEQDIGNRGSQRTLGESWQASSADFRDGQAADLRTEKAFRAEQVINTASPGQTVYSVAGDTEATSRAKAVARATGVKNHVLYASKGGGIVVRNAGRLSLTRGSYDSVSDTITACVNNSKATSEQITDHESVHRGISRGLIDVQNTLGEIRTRRPAIADTIDYIAEKYVEWSNGCLDRDAAIEELFCDAGGKINQFADYDDELSQELAGFMDTISAEIRPMLNEALGGALEAADFNEGFSAEGLTEAVAALDENGIAVADGAAVQYSYDTWIDTDKEELLEDLVNAGFDEDEAQKWIDDVSSVSAIIARNPNLNYKAGRGTWLKPNAETVKSLDGSFLCPKKSLFQGTYNAIAAKNPNITLDAEQYIKLKNLLRSKGYEVPCVYCYNESRVQQIGTYAKEFVEQHKDWKVTSRDLTTTDGLAKLEKNRPDVYREWLKYRQTGHGLQRSVKFEANNIAYTRDDIMNMSAEDRRAIMAEGGLRWFAFSDFKTEQLIDAMQAVLDLSAMNMRSYGYTKQSDFVRVFGNTGIMINMSVAGELKDGKLVFDSTDGMDIDTALALRESHSKTAGLTLVGINDEHILAAMADPRIDMIIPFHRSGLSNQDMRDLGISHYTDYQTRGSQNEHWVSDGKTVGKNLLLSDYWDNTKSGKENAERYLRECRRTGRIPKFREFLDRHEDSRGRQYYTLKADGSTDGYWKLLVDFKMYDNDGNNIIQQEVRPNFDMDAAREILESYEGSADKLPVARDVVREFLKEQGTKYSAELIPDRGTIEKNFSKVAKMKSVALLSGDEFSKKQGTTLSDQVIKYYDSIGNKVNNPTIGEIILDSESVKNDIAHGVGRLKAIAFKAIPDTIRNGEVLSYIENYKDRNYDAAVIVAPISISGGQYKGDYNVAAVINVNKINNRAYLHEVGAKRIETPSEFKTLSFGQDPSQSSDKSLSIESILRRLQFEQAKNEISQRAGKDNEFVTPGTGENVQYSIRLEPPPKKTGKAYKVFLLKDGKLYPPMVANPGGEDTPAGVWLNADIGQAAPASKTGRLQVPAGGKGTATGKSSLAFRPGWHLGEVPLAKQFARTNPETGVKDLFPANFVWAECEYAMDRDYQDEAMSYGYTENGKFRHSYAGLPALPKDGYYKYRTNPNPDTVPWVITGAMKVNRILSDAEVAEICRQNGVEPMQRQGGPIDLAAHGIGDQVREKVSSWRSIPGQLSLNDIGHAMEQNPELNQTKQQNKLAAEAVQTLTKLTNADTGKPVDRGVALTITKELLESGKTELVGKRVKNADDLAALAQVYRDPRFETLRYFFADADGNLVFQTAVSSGVPNASLTIPSGENYNEYLDRLSNAAKKQGATTVYMLHNHPSGNVSPSREDMTATGSLYHSFKQRGLNLSGSIVIDHTQYALLSDITDTTLTPSIKQLPRNAVNDLSDVFTPAKRHAILGTRVTSAADLEYIAKAEKAAEDSDDLVSLIFSDSKGHVRVIQKCGVEFANDREALTEHVRKVASGYGCPQAFAVTRNADAYNGVLRSLYSDSGVFTDVLLMSGGSLNDRTDPSFRDMLSEFGKPGGNYDEFMGKKIEGFREGSMKFSSELVPTFYSKLQREVEGYKGDKIGASSVESYLKSRGVKDEEIKWSGIRQYLEGKKSVSKKELAEYLKENEFKVETKILGESVNSNLWTNGYSDVDITHYYATTESGIAGSMEFESPDDFRTAAITAAEMDGLDPADIEFDIDTEHGYLSAEIPDADWILEAQTPDTYDLEDAGFRPVGESRWGAYKLDGGTNYRELLFVDPKSTYSNRAMSVHWGDNNPGVLAHARVQDFDSPAGKVLFVEEIQSDWHNAGKKHGYGSENERSVAEDYRKEQKDYIRKELENQYSKEDVDVFLGDNGEAIAAFKTDKYFAMLDAETEAQHKWRDENPDKYRFIMRTAIDSQYVPDAPFRDTYTNYVLKNLLRMAAEGDYDYLAWTTGKMQEERWSDEYAEGYRIEYDQEIPKFLKKYGKQWGAGLTDVRLPGNGSDIEFLTEQLNAVRNSDDWMTDRNLDYAADLEKQLEKAKGYTAPAIVINDAMKDSVLHEGQPMYSTELRPDPKMLDRAVRELHHIRNIRNIEEVEKRNDRLASLNMAFNDALTAMPDNPVTKHQTYQIANKYLAGGSDALKKEVRSNIAQLYELMGQATKVNARQLTEAAVTIAEKIVSNADRYERSSEMKDMSARLKRTKFYISPELKKEIEYNYGSYVEFRRKYARFMGMTLDRSKATDTVDSFYEGVSGSAGGMAGVHREWFPADITNEADQLIQIADVAKLTATGEKLTEDYGEDYEEIVYTMAQEILADYFRANGNDKYMQKVNAIKQELREEYEARLDFAAMQYKDQLSKKDADLAKKQAQFLAYKDEQRNRRFDKAMRDKLWQRIRTLRKMKGDENFNREKAEIFSEISAVRRGALSPATVARLNELASSDEVNNPLNPLYTVKHHLAALREIEELDRKHVGDMTAEEVASYLNAVTELIHYQRTQNRLLDETKGKYVSKKGRTLIRQQDEVSERKMNRWLEAYRINSLAPIRALPLFDGYVPDGVMAEYAKKFFDGDMKSQKYMMDAEKSFAEWLEDEKYMRDLTKYDIELTNSAGRKVKVSRDMAIAMYLAGRDAGNVMHTEAGGWLIPNEKLYRGGKRSESYYDPTDFVMKQQDYAQLDRILTDKDKRFADAISKYFNDTSKKAMNEVSRKLYGYDIAMVDNYFPITVDKSLITRDIDVYNDPTLESSGFTKERTKSTLPIYLDGVTNVLKRSINNVGRYYGMAVPLRDFNSVYNFTAYDNPFDPGRRLVSGKKAFEHAWRTPGKEYLENLMSDLNRGSRERQKDLLDYVYAGYGSAVLGANVRVMLSQASSYPMALTILHPDSLAKGLAASNRSVDMDYIDSITPSMYMRRKGMTGTELGEMYSARQRLREKPVAGAILKSLDVLTGGIQRVDVWTTTHLVSACKAEIETYYPDLKPGTKAYDNKLADLIEQVNSRTQPSYGIMNRNEYSKRSGAGWKILTMFKTQVFNMYGELYDAMGRDAAYRKLYKDGKVTRSQANKARTDAAAALLAVLLSQLLFELMKKAVDLSVYHNPGDARDEAGEVTAVSVAERVMKDTMKDLIGMAPGADIAINQTAVPLVKNALSGRETIYDIDAPGLGTVNDIRSAADSLAKASAAYRADPSEKNRAALQKKAAQFVIKASYLGYPLQNSYNTLNGLWMNWKYKPFNYDQGEGLWGLKDNSPSSEQYANMAIRSFANGNEERGSFAVGHTTTTKLEDVLGAEASRKEDGSAKQGSKAANAMQKINDLDMSDEAKINLIEAMYSKLDGMTPENLDDYIGVRAAKAEGGQDAVIDYLKGSNLSEDSKRTLWELAGEFSAKTYNQKMK